MATQTVTLLTDWGNADHYAAVVKARLFAKIPDVRVVDISHSVPRSDIYAAAYMAIDSYPYFPEGTIHIVGVEDIATKDNVHLVVKFGQQFIIGTDNGFFTILQILSGKTMDLVYEIEVSKETKSFTFPARDLFPRVASMLSVGMPLDKIGKLSRLHSRVFDGPGLKVQRTSENINGNMTGMHLTGRVLFIDDFGNIITNITKKEYDACLEACPGGYEFKDMYVDLRRINGKIVDTYDNVPIAAPAFIFLENGFLEIAENKENFYKKMGIARGAKVIMRFGPKIK